MPVARGAVKGISSVWKAREFGMRSDICSHHDPRKAVTSRAMLSASGVQKARSPSTSLGAQYGMDSPKKTLVAISSPRNVPAAMSSPRTDHPRKKKSQSEQTA